MKRKEQKQASKTPEPPCRNAPGYVRSAPKEINARVVQIDGASFADAARDFGHRNVVGKWVYG